MLRLAKGSTLRADYIDAQAAPKGFELFVVSGRLENGDAAHAAVYVKRTHLGG